MSISLKKKFAVAFAIPVLMAVGIYVDCQILLHCIRPTVVDCNTVAVELFGQVHEYQN